MEERNKKKMITLISNKIENKARDDKKKTLKKMQNGCIFI